MTNSISSIVDLKVDVLFSYIDDLLFNGRGYSLFFTKEFRQSHIHYNRLIYKGVARELLVVLKANFPNHKVEILMNKERTIKVVMTSVK